MALADPIPHLPSTAPRPGGLREVFDLAYPVVLTQISATVMMVVDSAMVGRLGSTELAAVGFGSIWLWTIFSLFYGTASGVQTFVSQLDGAGESARSGPWAWHGMYAVVPAAGVACLVLAPLLDGALALLGPSAALQATASDYVSARLAGEVCLAITMVATAFFRGVGDTRTPMWVTIFANLVNGVLDYGLIFGALGMPAWGVAGAGFATAVANTAAAAVLMALLLRPGFAARYRTRPVAPSAVALLRFLRTGLPIGGQWAVGMTSFAFFTTLVAHMGDDSMAASQAFVMLLSLSFMQAMGLSVATQTLVGRYVGARDEGAVGRSFHSALRLGIAVGLLVAALFLAAPGALLRIFSDDPGVVALGRPLLVIGALFQLLDAVAIITDGALRGAGDTRWPFWVQTAFGWGLFIPLAWLLGVTLGGGLRGAWLGGLISLACSTGVLVWRFHSGAWQRIRI